MNFDLRLKHKTQNNEICRSFKNWIYELGDSGKHITEKCISIPYLYNEKFYKYKNVYKINLFIFRSLYKSHKIIATSIQFLKHYSQ